MPQPLDAGAEVAQGVDDVLFNEPLAQIMEDPNEDEM